MDEEEVSATSMFISKEKTDSLYPMYFGVSCAFVALELLSGPDMDNGRWSEARDRMLQGSAHLLGLLVWRIQRGEVTEGWSELLHKLEKAKTEVEELKRRRSEDAKANEKVVGIFATQEQSWLSERKKLQQQIRALLNELQVLEIKKRETISNFNVNVQEKELRIQSRDKALEEEERKRKEVEEKLQKAEAVAEELRETAKKEAQEHSSELWKHKTAFIELVSNQRQLEAEMGRTRRQFEAAKQELDSVFKLKEESVSMVQKLSMEIVKIQRDSEEKDKILSAMLRKSKLDSAEKQMLSKEVKISKARRKQAELETERWRAFHESRHEKHSSRSNSGNQANSRTGVNLFKAGCSQNQSTGSQLTGNRKGPETLFLKYLEAEHRKERECITTLRTFNVISDGSDRYSPEANKELVITTNVKQLEGWVRSETEEHTSMLEQRHHLEIDAFAEQLRLKDEKLEAFRWRLLSMELESKRLQSHMDGLDQKLSQMREENLKLEALLLDREAELRSLREKIIILQLHTPQSRKTSSNSSSKDLTLVQETIWSEIKTIKRKSREREEEPKPILIRIPQEVETEKEENPFEDPSKDKSLTVKAPQEDIKVEKEVAMDLGHVRQECVRPPEAEVVDKLASVGHCLIKKGSSPWKMDLHALGVSYKIKRLNQQLLMLERLAGTPNCFDEGRTNDHGLPHIKGFILLMSSLNKQVSRYQSLQEKIDALCKRMHENDLDGSSGDSSIARTKEETKTLENFLEETFHLQRNMVATGQKSMEIQSRIASAFVGDAEELEISAGFNMRQSADSVRTLFREVQRGLEVRIARIIGDLEGTLACEGIIHSRN